MKTCYDCPFYDPYSRLCRRYGILVDNPLTLPCINIVSRSKFRGVRLNKTFYLLMLLIMFSPLLVLFLLGQSMVCNNSGCVIVLQKNAQFLPLILVGVGAAISFTLAFFMGGILKSTSRQLALLERRVRELEEKVRILEKEEARGY